MDVNFLGNFSSIEDVWHKYPEGGNEGDYLNVGGVKYRWNKYILKWENAEVVTDTSSRKAVMFSDVNVQNNVRAGGSMSVADNMTVEDDLTVGGMLRARHVKQPNLGLFPSVEALKSAHPKPVAGEWATVGNGVPAPVYRCDKDGVWAATGETGGVDALEGAVLYSGKQNLDESQKEMARENIGTVGAEEVIGNPAGDWDKGTAEAYIDKEIAKVKNWVSNTPVTDVVVVETLPASGKKNTLYRVKGTNAYSEYGWDGSKFVPLAVKEYGIDDFPTDDSDNLVKSGGVAKEIVDAESRIYGIKNGTDITTTVTTPFNTGIILNGGESYIISYKSKKLGSASGHIALYFTENYELIKSFSAKEVFDGVLVKFTPYKNGYLYARMNEIGIDVNVSVARQTNFVDTLDKINAVEKSAETSKLGIDNLNIMLSDLATPKDSVVAEKNNFIISSTTVEIHYNFAVKKGVRNYIYFKYPAKCTLRLYKNDTVNLLKDYGEVDFTDGVTLELDVPYDADYEYFRIRTSVIGTANVLRVTYQSVAAKVSEKDILDAINRWNGKKAVAYGDSITAQGNTGGGYSSVVAEALDLDMICRGVGGQTFKWNNNTFWAYPDGSYAGREGQGTQPDGTTTHRGCFCSWDRITAMIPEAIRNEINLILLMGGTNDHSSVEDVVNDGVIGAGNPIWMQGDNTDANWASSSFYNGGDYDVKTFVGAVASTVMKMQIWCPNAVIVLCTPLSRWDVNNKQQYSVNNVTLKDVSDIIIQTARYMSAPYIDVNSLTGINAFNYTNYITDGVHPNSKGQELIGSTISARLNEIPPKKTL